MKNESKKNDFIDGKLRWELLPIEQVEKMVKVLTEGANKYGENTWQGLDNGEDRYYAALMRHLVEWRKGNKIDKDTGCEHLAQVAINAIFLLYLEDNKKEK